MSESRPFQVLDLALINAQLQCHTSRPWSILVFPPKINRMCEPMKNNPKLDIIPKYKDNRLEGYGRILMIQIKHQVKFKLKKYRPTGLESSLKFDNCKICTLWVNVRNSSRNAGSPSRRSLWITTSVFRATYITQEELIVQIRPIQASGCAISTELHHTIQARPKINH